MTSIKDEIRLIPEEPGIYKYFDSNGDLLYIGKAKNLKKRVSSYFTQSKGQSGRIKHMVARIARLEFNIVYSETEALLLENSLIKKYQPRYNVRLKDGKTYPLLAIKKEHFPRVFSTRIVERDGSEYFGPFVSGLSKNYLIDLLQKTFKLRTCSLNLSPENIKKGKFRRCLDYHIGLCKAPCEGLQDEKEYLAEVDKVRNILKGNTAQVIDYVKKEMAGAAENLEFERANELKHTLEALENYQSKSVVVNPKIKNVDVFSIYATDELAIVNFLKVMNGAIISTDTFEYKKKLNEENTSILELAIAEMRANYDSRTKEIIVPELPAYCYEGIKYTVPKIGDKLKLLELSYKNAYFYYIDIQKRKAQKISKNEKFANFLKQVQTDLQLKSLPKRIDCFDNSNMQGSYPVAAMSVFKNGKAHKASYRHYNIKTVEGPDDFASMEEVLYRRYKRVLNEGKKDLPNLIVIDGGKGQLSSAYKILCELGIENEVDIIGIAKKLEELYKPGDQFPMAIDKKSPANRLLQQIRNEAHRFGITHHRNRRLKGSLITTLTDIPGIGQATSDTLLKQFKSVKKIASCTIKQLEEVVGLHKAQLVYNHFHRQGA